MLIAIFLTFVIIVVWFLIDVPKSKDAAKLSLIIGVLAIWGTFLFMKLDKWRPIANSYLYLACIPIFIFVVWVVYKSRNKKSLYIIAKQQSYWGIAPDKIYGYYKKRLNKKDDRIETEVNFQSKKLSMDNIEQYKVKDERLTKLKNIDDIKNIPLYFMILKKISNILKYLEKNDVDLGQILRQNDMCAEYFLLDLWENFTKNFNLGVANLEIYAQNEIQSELLGAIDSISLNSIKPNGAFLLYSFLEFREKQLQKNTNNNTAGV